MIAKELLEEMIVHDPYDEERHDQGMGDGPTGTTWIRWSGFGSWGNDDVCHGAWSSTASSSEQSMAEVDRLSDSSQSLR